MGWKYFVNRHLTDEAKALRRSENNALKAKISEAQQKKWEEKNRIRKQRNEAYWASHVDEKASLEEEKMQLEAEVKELDPKIASIDKDPAIIDLRDVIKKQKLERDALGLFKGKQKKLLDADIANKEAMLDKMIHEKKDPLTRQRDSKMGRIRQILNELTRDR